METFDLRGSHVGARTLKAITRAAKEGEIALDCKGARFVAALNLSDAMLTQADFSDAIFDHGMRFERVRFSNHASFDRASSTDLFLRRVNFEGKAGFRGLRAANLSVRETAFSRYASFDEAELGFGHFRDVDFAAEARFRSLKSRGPVTMRSVCFGGAASFHKGKLRQVSFPACQFKGPLHTRGLVVDDELSFPGSHFEDTRTLDLRAGSRIGLEGARFSRPVSVMVKGPALDAAGANFEQGVDIVLQAGSTATFSAAALGGTSLVVADALEPGPAARIESMDGTRVGYLTLEGLDLSECSFAKLHRLDDVLISGRGQLARAPERIKGTYRREVLADELDLRAASWSDAAHRKLRASGIADVYRAMRKAREGSHDYPGAADFYYGEMEMRRASADNWLERTILSLYWLCSGYGMRAGRAVLSYAVVVLLFAVGFQTFGFAQPPSFGHTVAWTLTTTISLTRSTEAIDLTTAGLYLSIPARLAGPTLIGLAVLALRSRVRR